MTDFPSVVLKTLMSFPASVLEGGGVRITKTNGVYTLSLAFDDYAPPITNIDPGDAPNLNALIWNIQNGVYNLVPIGLLGGGTAVGMLPGGRITLAGGVPVTESDMIGQGTAFYTPSGHDRLQIFDGVWSTYQVPQLSLPLDNNAAHLGYHQAGKNFFLGSFLSGSTPVLGSGPAWTTDVLPGVGAGTAEFEIFEGRMVNKVAANIRFGLATGNFVSVPPRQFTILGGIRTSANGLTDDSMAKRFVSNLYNPTIRPMRAVDPITNYFYDTNVARQANANAVNQLNFFHCVAGRMVAANVTATVRNVTTNAIVTTGIALDNILIQTGFVPNNGTVLNTFVTMAAFFRGFPGIGSHFLARMESGGGVGVNNTQWFSNNGTSADISGETLN